MDAARFFSLSAIAPLRLRKIERACKICGSRAPIFDVVDFLRCCDGGENPQPYKFGLSGVPVDDFRCECCDFMFTDFCDGWTHEDYSNAIYNSDYVAVDPDYVAIRPRLMAKVMADNLHNLEGCSILDYGSGSGVFSTAMAEYGYNNVVGYDPFSSPSRPNGLYDVVTCFEVIEHASQPLSVFEEIFSYLRPGGALIFSQSVQPSNIKETGCNWWYVGPRNGHISTFSVRTLYEIGIRHGMALWESSPTGFVMVRIGLDPNEILKAPCRKVENEFLLQPSSHNSSCWQDLETMPGGRFRWTSAEFMEWQAPLLSGVNTISLPYVNQIRDGYAEGCRMLVNGTEIGVKVEAMKISGEITSAAPGLVQVVVVLPPPVSPEVYGRDDRRKLGLAVPC